MRDGAKVGVVVPAYNEASRIQHTLRSIPAWVDSIVVIDDASRDDTAARARAVGDRRVEIVQAPRNAGVGRAVAEGYRLLFSRGAAVAAVMAGDGQMAPEYLSDVVGPVLEGRTDYVVGDRLSFPGARQRMPFLRWFGNHVLTRLTTWATGIPVRDSQSGYTALSAPGFQRLRLDRLWPRYGYPNDLLGKAARAGLRIEHVLVPPVYRDESSGIGWRHALFVVPWVIASVALRRIGRNLQLSWSTVRAS